MAPKYVKVMKEGKEAKIKYVENQEKLKCMVKCRFFAVGYPRYEFPCVSREAGLYCASLD